MRIAVKAPGESLRIIETTEKYRSNCTKHYTGEDSPAEFVRLNTLGTFSIGVNKEGLSLDLPENFLISTGSIYFPIQKIVGTAVFIRSKFENIYKHGRYDYEVEALTDDDIKHIAMLLDEEYQQELKDDFDNYGKGYTVIEAI